MSVVSRLAVVVLTASSGVVAGTVPALASIQQQPGRVVIVQAVPQKSLDVTVDGKTVQSATDVGAVLGPMSLSPGRHEVGFRDAGGDLALTSTVDVRPGSSTDIVVHLPASLGGKPVVNAYRTPRAPIAPGKARVLVAHTATVAPADVRVDGKVVFHDIANGEYATADVAAGSHSVALLPAGLTRNPILGPLHVDLKAGTVTMVYAVGDPKAGSMNVISHVATLTSNGASVPETIDTGQAGLAAGLPVHPFAPRPARAPSAPDPGPSPAYAVAVLLAVAGIGVLALRRRRAPRPS